MTRRTKETAAAVYAARRASISKKVSILSATLDVHCGTATQWPDDWRFAGDLGHVEELLDEMLSFLGVAGTEEPR